MKAIVVYESLWGNTAAVARAIADGIGDGASALTTSEATPEMVAAADLIVAGAPTHIAKLPTERTRQAAMQRATADAALPTPDLSHPSLAVWLDSLPHGSGSGAAFETRSAGWFGGGAASRISKALKRAGYRRADGPQSFTVVSQSGPLSDGELDRARAWGASLGASTPSRSPAAARTP